jgi:CDP-4-dehydro-6-deoxyglucose reductase
MSYQVKLNQSECSFINREGLTILDEAINAGLVLAYSCRNGSCGTCKATLLAGEVEHSSIATALSSNEINNDQILTCCAYPKSNLLVDIEYIPELANQKILTLPCLVDSITSCSGEVMIVSLRLPPDANFNFIPGQYIELIHGPARRSYSIAGCHGNVLELHVGYIPGGEISNFLHADAGPGTLLHLEGPFGTFIVRDTPLPKIFVAGGTGAAPIFAMIEKLIKESPAEEIFVYWGVRTGEIFYSDRFQQLTLQHATLNFTPVVSGIDETWTGSRGMVHEAVLRDFSDLQPFDVYACGPRPMIEAAREAFIARNLPIEHFHADLFVPTR